MPIRPVNIRHSADPDVRLRRAARFELPPTAAWLDLHRRPRSERLPLGQGFGRRPGIATLKFVSQSTHQKRQACARPISAWWSGVGHGVHLSAVLWLARVDLTGGDAGTCIVGHAGKRGLPWSRVAGQRDPLGVNLVRNVSSRVRGIRVESSPRDPRSRPMASTHRSQVHHDYRSSSGLLSRGRGRVCR